MLMVFQSVQLTIIHNKESIISETNSIIFLYICPKLIKHIFLIYSMFTQSIYYINILLVLKFIYFLKKIVSCGQLQLYPVQKSLRYIDYPGSVT